MLLFVDAVCRLFGVYGFLRVFVGLLNGSAGFCGVFSVGLQVWTRVVR